MTTIDNFIRRQTFVSCLCLLLMLSSSLLTIDAATTNSNRRPLISQQSDSGKAQQRPANVMHPAFAQAGKKPGLEVWRIENFEPVPVPAKDYGKFYTGDSYIVLFTKQVKDKFSWDIHFWLGSQTSQDESGAAAILSVELDDKLGGGPVQYREVQEHESQDFLSHFKGGVRYQDGGVNTGFKHVDPNAFEKRLFQVKGKRNVRVRQVEPSLSSMNKGDCFILDMKREIFVYVGQKAKRMERLKAITAANQIRDQDHAGRSKVYVIDEFSNEDEIEKFFKALGTGNRESVPDESTGGDDEAYENKDEGVALYRVTDASGSTKYEKITAKPLKQNLLNSNDCFYLDTGSAGIYAWIGKKCSERERKDVMSKAEQYLKEKKYPAWTHVQRIVEGGEPAAFKQFFEGWRDRGEINSRIMKRAVNTEDENEYRLLNALHKNKGKAATFMPDNGQQGEVKVFRVNAIENKLVPVQESLYGIFFAGDCYVVKYYNPVNNKYIIYVWQGAQSTENENIVATNLAIELGHQLNNGGRSMRIYVEQNHEPKHFIHIFNGKIITLLGDSSDNLHSRTTYNKNGCRLFRIRGTNSERSIRAAQLPCSASQLNSDDVFILETSTETYIWYGTGSSASERVSADELATRLSATNRNTQVINEGNEPDTFWDALGGKQSYERMYSEPITDDEPRLINCHISKTGKMKVEETKHFTQEDLNEDDVGILITNDEAYIWLGNDSSEEEKREVHRLIKVYLRKFPSERGRRVVFTIRQGEEPDSFKELFPTWNTELWNNHLTYEQMKQQIHDANNEIADD